MKLLRWVARWFANAKPLSEEHLKLVATEEQSPADMQTVRDMQWVQLDAYHNSSTGATRSDGETYT